MANGNQLRHWRGFHNWLGDFCLGPSEVMVSFRRIISLIGLFFLIGLIGTVSSHIFWQWWYSAPVKYLSATILNPEIRAGDSLIFRVTFDKKENCEGVADRSIMALDRQDGEHLAAFSQAILIPTKLGNSVSLIASIPTPNYLQPGYYLLRVITRQHCNHGTFILQVPEASFRVCEGEECSVSMEWPHDSHFAGG